MLHAVEIRLLLILSDSCTMVTEKRPLLLLYLLVRPKFKAAVVTIVFESRRVFKRYDVFVPLKIISQQVFMSSELNLKYHEEIE